MEIKRVKISKILLVLNFLNISIAVTQTFTLHNCTKLDLLKITKKENIHELTLNNCELNNLTRKDLAGFEKLTQLNIVSSELLKLANNVFSDLTQLRNLNLPKNKLNKLDNWTVEPLSALQALDLSENSLKTLQNESFKYYKNLQTLNLNGNRFEFLNPFSFHPLSYLSELYLANNLLKEVTASDFSTLATLRVLLLNHNQLEIVEKKSFESNTKLKYLDLSNNKLKELSFLPIKNLKQLNLSHNQIENLTAKTFQSSDELVELDLSFNILRSLKGEDFEGLSSLERLNLSHNMLENLNSDSFAALKSLKEIELGFNELETLPIGIFAVLRLLEIGDLSHNKLNTLDPHIFMELPFLVDVKLAHNGLSEVNFTSNFAKALQLDRLSLDLSQNSLTETILNISFLENFKSVNLAENIWSCNWLISELFAASATVQFGHDYQLSSTRLRNDAPNIRGLSCIDDNKNRSILLLNLTTAHTDVDKTCNCETNHRNLNPSPPPVVWPKLYMDKFDSRSVIIWMLIAIAIAFAALRIGRRFLEKNDRKRRFMRKFLPQQSHNTEMEVLRFEDNTSSRSSTAGPCQQLPPNATSTDSCAPKQK